MLSTSVRCSTASAQIARWLINERLGIGVPLAVMAVAATNVPVLPFVSPRCLCEKNQDGLPPSL